MPKLFIVSNNALSKSDSNGRTLMNFLGRFDPEDLAQFYIHGQADETCCGHYYRVSDRDMLFAVKHFGKTKKPRTSVPTSAGQNGVAAAASNDRKKRSTRNLVLRDTAWRTYLWWNKDFDSFVSAFGPDAVLLQAGDCPFMFRIALKLARKYKVPLILYNSEGYVLKDVLYASSSKKDLWHNILQRRLKKAYKKMMSRAAYCFYSTEYLEKCYQEKYPHPQKSCTLYTSSELHPLEDRSGRPFQLAYCGNLGVGRIKPLCEIAEVLQTVDETATMQIYGSFICEADEKRLCQYPNVRYGGRVPYEQVLEVMSGANLILHCENAKRVKNLIYAFSTKIADCVTCGRPFLVYADAEYPFVQYLQENHAAHVAGNKEELKEILTRCFANPTFLESHIPDALALASRNHSIANNSERFYAIICSLVKSAET